MARLSERPEPSRHLVIAGTGRAGTSFLVRYLAALGLDTGLTSPDDVTNWENNANAGLEHLPLPDDSTPLPYVIKSPLIGEFADTFFASDRMKVDGLIVPMRSLVEAATSRAILEHRAIYQDASWMLDFDANWDAFGHTAGGLMYSLNPVDQARLLAVSFHNLVLHALEADVPIVFLGFPRIIEDADYLHRMLRPLLPETIDADQARRAHDRVTDRSKVRVGDELGRAKTNLPNPPMGGVTRYPSQSEVEVIALRRELKRMQAAQARLEAHSVFRAASTVYRLVRRAWPSGRS